MFSEFTEDVAPNLNFRIYSLDRKIFGRLPITRMCHQKEHQLNQLLNVVSFNLVRAIVTREIVIQREVTILRFTDCTFVGW